MPFTTSYRSVELNADMEFWITLQRPADNGPGFNEDKAYTGGIIAIRRALAGTNWRSARWPKWLQPLLKVPDKVPAFELRRLTCRPRNRRQGA